MITAAIDAATSNPCYGHLAPAECPVQGENCRPPILEIQEFRVIETRGGNLTANPLNRPA